MTTDIFEQNKLLRDFVQNVIDSLDVMYETMPAGVARSSVGGYFVGVHQNALRLRDMPVVVRNEPQPTKPVIEVVDNTNAANYGGYELVDNSTIPPTTFAIAMHKDYAERAARCMNAHDDLVQRVQKPAE